MRALSRRSVRSRTGQFLAEGPQAVREAVRFAPDTVRDVYVTPEAALRHAEILDAAHAAGVFAHSVSGEVMAVMCDTEVPQGIAAVCAAVDRPLAEVVGKLGNAGFVCVLTNVRDPGNAGTVIRGADAAGATAVIVSDCSVDIYNSKVVRSTVGSLWHLPVSVGVPIPQIVEALRAKGIRLLAADGAGETLLPQADLTRPHAWVFGNEAWGLEAEVRDACDEVVRVPIHGHAESLNLAMAATLCLYASAAAQHC